MLFLSKYYSWKCIYFIGMLLFYVFLGMRERMPRDISNSKPKYYISPLIRFRRQFVRIYFRGILFPYWPNYDTPLPLTKFNGKINGIHDTPLHKNVKLNTTPWPTGNYDTPLLLQLFIFRLMSFIAYKLYQQSITNTRFIAH